MGKNVECVIGPICREEIAGRCQQAGAECPVKIVFAPIAGNVKMAVQVLLNIEPDQGGYQNEVD